MNMLTYMDYGMYPMVETPKIHKPPKIAIPFQWSVATVDYLEQVFSTFLPGENFEKMFGLVGTLALKITKKK